MKKIEMIQLRDLILDGITTEELKQYDYSHITDMSGMFYRRDSLKTVPQFDTSNVTNMGSMFFKCYDLESIPEFDMSKVVNARAMFYQCYNLKYIKMTLNEKCLHHNIITGCSSLIDIDINVDVDIASANSPYLREKYAEFFI